MIFYDGYVLSLTPRVSGYLSRLCLGPESIPLCGSGIEDKLSKRERLKTHCTRYSCMGPVRGNGYCRPFHRRESSHTHTHREMPTFLSARFLALLLPFLESLV